MIARSEENSLISDNGYLINAESVQRVEAISLHQENGQFYSEYKPISDILDLDDEMQAEIIAEVKKIILEISSRFQGSEQFTRPIDKMNSIGQIMGYIMPYMPIKLSEKQDLLEIASVRERYLAFLYILAKQKENINLQIEVAQKVSEKINKSHREAMLREQLKVIQEELDEGDGSTLCNGGYRERIENSKMPDDLRKKALTEVKKLEIGGSHNPESFVIRNYLDLLLDLPWVTEEKKR